MKDLDALELPQLPPRLPDSHKGTYGKALVIAGSRGMTGAATMAAMSALRSGAGMVTVATPVSCVAPIAAFHPAYMVIGMPETLDGQLAKESLAALVELSQRMDGVAIGPGLGLGEQTQAVVCDLYDRLPLPMIVDADAIAALGGHGKLAAAPRVLTPHLGEFRKLCGQVDLTVDDAKRLVYQVASEKEVVVVLKGHRSVITDGSCFRVNTTGNPGMATAGSGDVLSGMILSLLVQGMDAIDAAALAVHLHGMAGDMAAEGLGMHSLIATDIIDYLPSAFSEYLDPTGLD